MSRRLYKYFTFNKDEDLDKRFHEEMTAQLCLKIKGGFAVMTSTTGLDTLYEKCDDLPIEVKNKVRFILGEVDKMAGEVGALKVKLKKTALHNLFDFVQILDSEKGEIANYKAFLQSFLDLDAELVAASLSVTEEDQPAKSYSYWTGQNSNGTYYRKIRYVFTEWIRMNFEDLIMKKIIKRKRTSSDSFSFEDKKVLYTFQDAKERDGADIDILDLYFQKYEVDHVISVADGGETELINAELMEKQKNRSKGKKSNQPHFPHQELL